MPDEAASLWYPPGFALRAAVRPRTKPRAAQVVAVGGEEWFNVARSGGIVGPAGD